MGRAGEVEQRVEKKGCLELIFPFDTISGFVNLLFFVVFSLILILFPELSYPFPEN